VKDIRRQLEGEHHKFTATSKKRVMGLFWGLGSGGKLQEERGRKKRRQDGNGTGKRDRSGRVQAFARPPANRKRKLKQKTFYNRSGQDQEGKERTLGAGKGKARGPKKGAKSRPKDKVMSYGYWGCQQHRRRGGGEFAKEKVQKRKRKQHHTFYGHQKGAAYLKEIDKTAQGGTPTKHAERTERGDGTFEKKVANPEGRGESSNS